MHISDTQYISLRDATKYCHHSQDYLKLRARQGKLKAVKIGRNWVTMREWLEEYLKKAKKERQSLKLLKLKPVILFLLLGLVIILFLSFIEAEYFQWVGSQTKIFLANVGEVIPSKVIEIE